MKLLCSLIVFIFCLTGCATNEKVHSVRSGGSKEYKTIYVIKHGWHTGIVIRKDDVYPLFPELIKNHPNAYFIEISWGDKKYFMAPEDDLFLALRAALWPTNSVVRILGYSEGYFEKLPGRNIEPLKLPKNDFERMIRFLKANFSKDEGGSLIQVGKSNNYYLSNKKYWGIRTCNYWIAKALKKGSFPVRPFFSLTSGSVMKRVQNINEAK